MSKHTKGPWHVADMKITAAVGDNPFETIATVTTLPCIGGSDEYAAQKASDMERANIRLMAAAPELLEALKQLAQEEFRDDDDPVLGAARFKARFAVAQAEGK